MYTRKKLALLALLIAALLLASALPALAAPPRPDWCKSGACILACWYKLPMVAPFGALSRDAKFCAAIGAPMTWYSTRR